MPKESKYEERHLCFLDILGFSQFTMRSANCPEEFYRIGGALAEIESDMQRWLLPNYPPSPRLEWRGWWFSDSIVITAPPDGGGLRSVLMNAHYLYGRLLHERGLLIRGAVVKGLVYEGQEIIFGPALVEAHCLESEQARYPRVILQEGLLSAGDRELLKTGDTPSRSFTVSVDPDDGKAYLDPFSNALTWVPRAPGELPDMTRWLERVREVVLEGIDTEYRDKYAWMGRRFNEYLCTDRVEGVEPIHLD